jgi:Ca2+-binding EF-hand superfamily protein
MVSRVTFTALFLLACSAAGADDARHLLYLSDAGPLLIQLNVTIDGESPSAVWDKFVEQLFTDLDRDNSGTLEGKEADGVPTRRQLQQLGLPSAGGRSAAAATADSSPPDGRVTKDELADYLERIVGDPLAVAFTTQRRGEDLLVAAFASSSSSSGDEGLMEQLDVDDDEKLAAAEFALSPEMRKLDLDDDGTISRGELQPLQSPYRRLARPTRGSSQNDEAPIIDLGGGESPIRLVRRLIARYDSGEKDGRLSREELKSRGKWFATLDLDGNEQLDFDELRQLLRGRSPHVLVTVRLGDRKRDERAVEIEVQPAAKDVIDDIRDGGPTNAVLALAKTQLEFNTTPNVSPRTATSIFEQQFGALDRDNNGYLERKEVDNNPLLRDAFAQMDADDDEKVFKEEFVSYFKRIIAAARARTAVTISNQGNRLFDILDTGRDGRLSSRELTAGRDKIAVWDEDGDRLVAASEIPQTWRFTFARGAPRFGGVNVVQSSPTATAATPPAASGPAWFTEMDRNGDGELTRREFLGPLSDFTRLDADNNGALDAAEALAVDQLADQH